MHAVILAGGVGARLWPLSREQYPKQLHKFNGDHTLLQETLLRVNDLVPFKNMYIVTNDTHSVNIKMQSNELSGNNDVSVLLEPAGRNTAPAIALALFFLKRKGLDDEVVVVLPSDHMVNDKDAFSQALAIGAKAASDGWIVTFGAKPDRPETGYGYIKVKKQDTGRGFYNADKFVEKPDLKTAQRYLEEGGYYWNSGMFMFTVATALDEFKRYLPTIYTAFEQADLTDSSLENLYANLESISIDYGIMEKSQRVVVVPVNIGWSDVGSWDYLYKSLPADENGNVLQGKVLSLNSKNNLIFSERKLTAMIGLEDMVVVNTDDALLVCSKEQSQEVKKIVDILKKEHAEEYQIHKTVEKPWGYYMLLEKGQRYKIKRVMVKPGKRLSMQLHHHRSEHWVVVAGTAKIINGEQEFYLHTNESTYIPMSTKHRLENPGKVPLEIIEVQNGDYIEEDDIVRFEDDYDRAGEESFDK